MIYDTTIIGAGLTGLMCGYILSKEGQNVCIVEKNHSVGGSIQNFERNGVVFDTGAHYIGGLHEGQSLYRYFKYFNLIDRLVLKKLDPEGFDIIKFADKEYKYAEGKDNFVEKLSGYFPKEREAIKKYINKLKEITKYFPFYNIDLDLNNRNKNDILSINAYKYISSLSTNRKLIDVLTGTSLIHNGEPSKTPLFLHALIGYGYIESSWRVVGGSGKIANFLSSSIKSFGGKIYTDSMVQKINADEKKIKSITLKSGEEIRSKNFISTIHPSLTMKLLKTKLLRKSYRNRINNIENTAGIFSVYIIFKKNSFRYRNSNFFCFDKNTSWETINRNDRVFGNNLFFMTPAISKNDKFAESGIILAKMEFDDVINLKNTTVEKRGDYYKKFKTAKAEQMIAKMEQYFPNFKQNIDKYYTSTPLTYRDYTGTKNGSAYGVIKNSNEPYNVILPVTKIPNFYFAGQNINVHGVHGVTISAVITCSLLLGKKYLINKIRTQN